jgi:hypothetical protein
MSRKSALAAAVKAHASVTPRLADPVFAVLDVLRLVKAEHVAALHALSDREEREGLLRDEWPEWERFCTTSKREQEAKYDACAVVPTTAAGIVAFVRFLASDMIFDEVEFGYYGAEDATRQALSNLDHVLTRLAASAL